MQYVGVEFHSSPGRVYSYQFDGEQPGNDEWESGQRVAVLEVGDRVMVPPNWVNSEVSFANVVKVYNSREEISYKGELAEILGVVEDDG